MTNLYTVVRILRSILVVVPSVNRQPPLPHAEPTKNSSSSAPRNQPVLSLFGLCDTDIVQLVQLES